MNIPRPAESGGGAEGRDEEERICKFYVSIVSAPGGVVALLDTMDNATLVAKFQKEDGSRPEESFPPSDPIYVSLTFSNPTTCKDIYVVLARKNFPRGGWY